MASLDLIVDISTTVGGPSLQVSSFGIPMVAASFTSPAWVERYRSYSDLDAVLADGFTVTSTVYRALATVFSQDPTVSLVGVGRRALASTNQLVITPVAASSRLYSLDVLGVDGVAYMANYSSDSSATVAEICAGLVASINGLAAGAAVTATDNTTNLSILADVAGQYFAVAPTNACAALVSMAQPHADPGIATDLAAIASENSEWYGVTLADDQGAATITAGAVWCAANGKFLVTGSQDSAIAAAGSADVASVVMATSNNYAEVAYHARAGLECIGGAVLGMFFSRDPGSVVLAGKTLAGISADVLSSTQLGYITSKRALSYTSYGSLSLLREGRMAGGQWADVVRDMDWFEAIAQADLVDAIASNDKLPYTDLGAAVLAGVLRSCLQRAEKAGVFAPGWSVWIPAVSVAAPADKNNRIYRPIKYFATLAGAIQSIEVRGSVTP